MRRQPYRARVRRRPRSTNCRIHQDAYVENVKPLVCSNFSTARFYDGRRGHVRLALARHSPRADFRTVSAVTKPGASVTTAASFVTEVCCPGPQCL